VLRIGRRCSGERFRPQGGTIERTKAGAGLGGGFGHPGPKHGHRVELHRADAVEARQTDPP
jgi:hypothetical protein